MLRLFNKKSRKFCFGSLILLCSLCALLCLSSCSIPIPEPAGPSGNASDVSVVDLPVYSADVSENTSEAVSEPVSEEESRPAVSLTFASKKLLNDHYNKHGIEMGFASAEDYLAAANRVVNNPDALHKLEAEDGDDVYYVEATNEFVVVSTAGYIRTYFLPSGGKAYFDRQ